MDNALNIGDVIPKANGAFINTEAATQITETTLHNPDVKHHKIGSETLIKGTASLNTETTPEQQNTLQRPNTTNSRQLDTSPIRPAITSLRSEAIPQPTESTSQDSEPTNRPLAGGAKGDDVRELQGLLTKHGHHLKSDGAFGVKTEKAVRHYQSKNGLTVDGRVGSATWDSLRTTPI